MIQLSNAVNYFNKVILQELYEQKVNVWVAGGIIRDYFLGKPLNTDYDLFFKSAKDFEKAFNYFHSQGAKVIWESENGCKLKYNDLTFDLIKHYFESPQKTIEAFDFTVSMFAVDKEKVYYGPSSFIDLARKQLMLNQLPYPASTLSRAFRYYKKGFTMCQEEMLKLVNAIKAMPSIEENTDQGTSEQQSSGKFAGFD